MYVVKAEQIKQIDEYTIKNYGIPGIVLMENAAERVMQAVEKYNPNLTIVVCGPGNNGGDGLAVARKMHVKGLPVTVLLLCDPSQYKGDASINYQAAVKCSVKIVPYMSQVQIVENTVVVDAIFGTGLNRPVTKHYQQVIVWMNQLLATIVSIDIPSGINGTTGECMGCAVKANETVILHCAKIGNLLYPGREYAGKLNIVEISIPYTVHGQVKSQIETWFDKKEASEHLVKRKTDGHKGSFGKALVIAGSQTMVGAPCLTAQSTLCTGAGVVTLAVPSNIQPIVATKLTEVMTLPLLSKDGQWASMKAEQLNSLVKNADVVAIGPGLGKSEEINLNIKNILNIKDISIVLDADGINALSHMQEIRNEYKTIEVMTPHAMELARLMHCELECVLKQPIKMALNCAKKYSAVIVLKGAATIVADTMGNVYINTTGNSGMATAGSGDVLIGIITGLMAQNYSPYDAAKLGVFIHGLAGDKVALVHGEHGVIAGEMVKSIGAVIKELTE